MIHPVSRDVKGIARSEDTPIIANGSANHRSAAMPIIWDPDLRRSFVARLDTLPADRKPGWGKLAAAGVVAHLNDSYRLALGDLRAKPRGGPLRFTPLRQLIIFVLPFPKSVPTAPELLARCGAASLDEERRQFSLLMDRLGQVTKDTTLAEHPAFGKLTHKAYGTLMARHTEHHFKQFGL